MKNLFYLSAFIFPSLVFGGPFGFDIGKNLSDYSGVDFSKQEKKSWYIAKNVPTPNKLMDMYVLRTTDSSGICFIKGISNTIKTSKYGTELNSQYENVRGAIKKKYQAEYKEKKTNFLQSGSLWDDSQYYMMGLLKKDRYKYSEFTAKDSTSQIQSIFIVQSALSTESGYISIEYYGKNVGDCDALDSADDADGF